MKSGTNGKNYQRPNDQFVETNKLDHRNTDSARPFPELDPRRIQLSHSPSWTNPVRRTAELDPRLIQLGRSLSWSSSANDRAGSTKTCLRLVLVTPLPKLHRTHSCFVSNGGIIGTLRFKNRGNSSFF
ncbi:hypothetical protein DY000_02014979 [Brassica cretica]|uniref:Uncharacterized protein n=1 Tax=Brassica cretica TaxID=69181 RepID=A0ABQ7CWN4_BRACR|nr:hypothetical protein DY000_02014979 [Brassica cretica]